VGFPGEFLQENKGVTPPVFSVHRGSDRLAKKVSILTGAAGCAEKYNTVSYKNNSKNTANSKKWGAPRSARRISLLGHFGIFVVVFFSIQCGRAQVLQKRYNFRSTALAFEKIALPAVFSSTVVAQEKLRPFLQELTLIVFLGTGGSAGNKDGSFLSKRWTFVTQEYHLNVQPGNS